MRKPKHKPPSRVRYDRAHPNISFRLDRDLRIRLEEVLKGESFASFIKEALGEREREIESLEDARSGGYIKGYERARDEFLVHAPGSICGKPVYIRGDAGKRDLAQYMRSRGYCHVGCKRR